MKVRFFSSLPCTTILLVAASSWMFFNGEETNTTIDAVVIQSIADVTHPSYEGTPPFDEAVSTTASSHTHLRQHQQGRELQNDDKRGADRGDTTTRQSCVDFKPYPSQNNGIWHDSAGTTYTCAWYEGRNRNDNDACNKWGRGYSNFGHTANSACCTCGGGNFQQIKARKLTNTVRDTSNRVVREELCIDVRKGNKESGTPLWLWPCNGSPAQLFYYDMGYIRSGLDQYKCIVGQGLESEQSTQLVIDDCPDSNPCPTIHLY